MPGDAYESDTGERDTPTFSHFARNLPVTKVIGIPLGRGRKALNRKCRAIARIASNNGWSAPAIGHIFNVRPDVILDCVSETRRRKAHRHDETQNDLHYAGEDFSGVFPDAPRKVRNPGPDAKGNLRKPDSSASEDNGDERAPESSSSKRKSISSSAPVSPFMTVKKPRLASTFSTSFHPAPLPKVPNSVSPLQIFFDSIPTLKLIALNPSRLALFAARGFTAAYLRTIGVQWSGENISDAVDRLLKHDVDAHGCLPELDLTILKVGLGTLGQPDTQTGPASTLGSASSLSAFLTSVHGFDFSVHLASFTRHGLTLERLRELALITPASPAAVYEILSRTLQRKSSANPTTQELEKGLSPLEVLALEFCLRAEGLRVAVVT
ncbi:hypothetical protein HMN09_00925800 [Mycena chlorophos]|uniref:Uncharacterized protein n=1 Tax=Mycena chlorophos TaxID=658473 RepID=A0A8H6W2C8_MYCCL|nr:hypothetical protein HMN09_00925800 [Mycena chlorophos]